MLNSSVYYVWYLSLYGLYRNIWTFKDTNDNLTLTWIKFIQTLSRTMYQSYSTVPLLLTLISFRYDYVHIYEYTGCILYEQLHKNQCMYKTYIWTLWKAELKYSRKCLGWLMNNYFMKPHQMQAWPYVLEYWQFHLTTTSLNNDMHMNSEKLDMKLTIFHHMILNTGILDFLSYL